MCHIINHLYRKRQKVLPQRDEERKRERKSEKKKENKKWSWGLKKVDKAMHYSTKNTAVAIERTTFLLISFSSVATAPRPICHVSLVIWRQSITNRLPWKLDMAPPSGGKRSVSVVMHFAFLSEVYTRYCIVRLDWRIRAKGNEHCRVVPKSMHKSQTSGKQKLYKYSIGEDRYSRRKIGRILKNH
ncbi:hypothetical protein AVEN_210290-1 [Araneus ventricosus]|uniref:Uncharacterized protein n=1 Tax=Araneus ventricosus TaxID=182803 RepID=A0A4Y2K5A4_ARAVE|nr:hypothetical protein AVEN_144394-1 [Araneus ventricosus]GBM98743.1 hypothetical protein AVEN_273166-1 [Araneus ventricosus]GBM98816.1 hypothetical protein AVEN_92671-1 [Araneus ventricosus]GBN00208.1 hypothetical protein AVEN_210290-1 [Araneus ventricosus]